MERLDEFQEGAMSTSIWKEKYNIIYTALGLASEAGEVYRNTDGLDLLRKVGIKCECFSDGEK